MFALRALSQFSRRGPSAFAAEPVAGQLLEWQSESEPPDAQELLARLAGMSPLLARAPQVPAQKDAGHTLCDAVGQLARFLLCPERIVVETGFSSPVQARRWAVVVGAHQADLGWRALTLARELLEAAAAPGRELGDGLHASIEALRAAVREAHPDEDHRVLMLGARRLGIPMVQTGEAGILQFGWGARGRTLADLIGARGASPAVQAPLHLLVVDGALVAATRQDAVRPRDVLGRIPSHVREACASLAASAGRRVVGLTAQAIDAPSADALALAIDPSPSLALHAAAGCDAARLGAAVLGSETGRIPLVLALTSAQQLAALESQWRAAAAAVAIPGRRTCTIDSVAAALLERDCRSVVLLQSLHQLMSEGLPVDRCDTALFVGGMDPEAVAKAVRVLESRKAFQRRATLPDIAAGVRAIGKSLGPTMEAPAVIIAPEPVAAALPDSLKVLREHKLTRGPAMFALMRDESLLLPHFLDHHRRLGVENFILYDDHSTDSSREIALAAPDCTLMESPVKFNHPMPGGRAFHHFLKEAVPESLGAGRWVFAMDIDEFVMLPPGFDDLPAFERALDALGHDCVFGTMVDAHPATLAERNYDPSISPFMGSPYFDIQRGFRRRLQGSPEKTLNGVRGRLVDLLRRRHPDEHRAIFGGRGYLMPALHKVPMVKTGRGITRFNAHTVNRQPPVGVEIALAHFKFGPDLDAKVRDALAVRQHYLQSIEYLFLDAALRLLAAEDLRYEGTRRFDEPGALAAAGLVQFDP